VDPLDEEAIAAAILRVVGDEKLRARMSSLSLAQASKLTWDASAAQTWKVLEGCCHA
jgi:glycosyltransferase involved in cell wall biosynthesis